MGTGRKKDNPKIIVIVGPTASGKSDLAVSLAKKFDGEIISADSRQVYKGMDIGTGKIKEEEMKGVPHYLLDVADPKEKFSVAKYKLLAEEKVEEIINKKKLPIICGGTAFYVSAIADGIIIPEVPPDWKLRKKLEELKTEELFNKLKKIDIGRAKKIDEKNRRRLIRAIEIVDKTKKPVQKTRIEQKYNPLFIGIQIEKEKLHERIKRRLDQRLEEGMIDEVMTLNKSGVSWKILEDFGLEYRWIARYLQNKIDYNEMYESLLTDIKKFSKRQMTWWKNDKRISWIKKYKEAEKLIKNNAF